MSEHNSPSNEPKQMSRRKFTGTAAVVAAALPTALGGSSTALSETTTNTQTPPQLSPAGEAQLQAILSKYGQRLTDEEKADVRRLVAQIQKTGDALRAFQLENPDEPATTFRIYRSELQPLTRPR
ncbi:MAG TPA: hypothetical protein VKM94_03530 [Blastocatellia bacterium]|nr:hypothetical protein [Blastocatellia bacterium]